MSGVKRMLNVLISRHTAGQKSNFIKFLLSKKRKTLNYSPLTISIVATSRCTLACDMCPTHSRVIPKDYPHIQKNVKDINFDMFKEMIDVFPNALDVHIIGSGEPLLNKDFFRMVDYAAGKKMTVKTFSNGMAVKENIDNILGSKLNGITVSLNGHNAEEFNRMTGMDPKIYLDIYGAVERLIAERNIRKVKVKIKVSFIIDRQNLKFIPDMMEMALRLGADHTFFCNFLPSPYKGFSPDERSLFVDFGTIDFIKKAIGEYPLSIRKRFTMPSLINRDSKKNRCDTHFRQIRFDGDGNVSSCSMMLLNMTGHGNYRDRDVWNNDFFRGMRRAFLSPRGENVPGPCSVCPDNKGLTYKKDMIWN